MVDQVVMDLMDNKEKAIYFSLSFFGPEPGAGVFLTCISSISAFLNPAIILQFPFFDSSDIVS